MDWLINNGDRVLAITGPLHGRLFTYEGLRAVNDKARVQLREVIEDAHATVQETYIDPDDQLTKTRRVAIAERHSVSFLLSPDVFVKSFKPMPGSSADRAHASEA